MKSSTVWHGHSTRPSLPAGTARKASGHLSGRRPLHLANARPFGRLKAPLGLLLLRKRELAYGRRSRLITPPAKKNRAFPTGNALLYISLSSVALIASFISRAILNDLLAICNSRLLSTNRIVNCDGRVRPGGRTLFFFYYASSFSARSIRYPTPTWVWIRCGASGYRSNFLRRDAM